MIHIQIKRILKLSITIDSNRHKCITDAVIKGESPWKYTEAYMTDTDENYKG